MYAIYLNSKTKDNEYAKELCSKIHTKFLPGFLLILELVKNLLKKYKIPIIKKLCTDRIMYCEVSGA